MMISEECEAVFSYLKIGVVYEVHDIVEHDGEEYYFIVDEDEDLDGDPVPYLADLFTVVENDIENK